jgi:hypothetical protein
VSDSLDKRIDQFVLVPVWALDRCNDSNAIHLYVLLLKYANRARVAWPGQERLAKAMNASTRTVQRAVAELIRCGIMETKRRRSKAGELLGISYVLLKTPIKHHATPVAHGLPATGVENHATPVAEQELDPVLELEPDPTPSPSPKQDKPKNLGYGRHKNHVFCGDLFCIDLEKHNRFARRIIAAGENLTDHDLLGWYAARDHELSSGEEQTIDHPALWLEKQFAEGLKESVAS